MMRSKASFGRLLLLSPGSRVVGAASFDTELGHGELEQLLEDADDGEDDEGEHAAP